MIKRVLLILCLLAFAGLGWSAKSHVAWTGKLVPEDARAGESAQLVITGKIDDGWHIYALGEKPDGPVATSFDISAAKGLKADGAPVEPKPITFKDPNFENMELAMYEGGASFGVPVKLDKSLSGSQKMSVTVRDQTCNASLCARPEDQTVEISFTVGAGPARSEHMGAVTSVPEQPAEYSATLEGIKNGDTGSGQKARATDSTAATDNVALQLEKAKENGILAFMGFAFVSGLLALLTPCVFPMIPITVSYFSKAKEGERKTDYRGAVAYCLGIMGTFTALGLVVTAAFGATGINRIATNPWVNLALALLFIVLAANLFGLFEIVLPAGMVNKFNKQGKKPGILGPLLMGLTFTLTSFTCTVPFVGTILVSASQGQFLYPLLGMLAFSAAFALPFFLLALFPQWLAGLPKAGSWLTTVKGFMGFLELAAALKFLSNSDMVWQKGIFTRPVFIGIWTVIAALSALYLLGWIVLGHDAKPAKVGWIRKALGVAMVAATVVCLEGLRGGSLGSLNAFLPPTNYGKTESEDVQWVEHYRVALAQAQKENKPMLLNFTGVTCTNCRWMEQNMFPRPSVLNEMKNFVPVELFTDRQQQEDVDNSKLEDQLTHESTLPMYVIVSPDGKPLKAFGGSTTDEEKFLAFLKSANNQVAER